MKRHFLFLLVVGCGALLSGSVHAQTAEEAAVKATIDRLFEGMKKGDSAVAHSAFHPSARLQTAFFDRDGKPKLQAETIGEFMKAIGTPHKEVWDERLLRYDIKIDDNLATVWTPYEFYVDGKYSHEGIDAFQLFHAPEGWKIIQICDTRRKKK